MVAVGTEVISGIEIEVDKGRVIADMSLVAAVAISRFETIEKLGFADLVAGRRNFASHLLEENLVGSQRLGGVAVVVLGHFEEKGEFQRGWRNSFVVVVVVVVVVEELTVVAVGLHYMKIAD
jgi:hypothetical protein